MTLPPLTGHRELRERIRRAAASGRFPQSALFHGPAGVGKQRLALWTGALLLCEGEDAPCGGCRSCRMADRLEHPDLHWHFPLPRPKGPAASRLKLRERLEEARLEELERRRKSPLEARTADGATGIYLAAVEEIRSQAARRPAMSRRAVFVIGEAEAMVSQAASPEAANAFLKLLEEPPPHVTVLLTSSRPGALLPTIRSRALAVRVPPLEEEAVKAFLQRHAGLAEEAAAGAARLAQGSIGRALRIAGGVEAEEREMAAALLRAALSPRPGSPLRLAASLSASGARGSFAASLRSLNELLRDLLGASLGQAALAFQPEALGKVAGSLRPPPGAVIRALDHVERAEAAAAGNVNPQAIAATLLLDLRDALLPGSPPRAG